MFQFAQDQAVSQAAQEPRDFGLDGLALRQRGGLVVQDRAMQGERIVEDEAEWPLLLDPCDLRVMSSIPPQITTTAHSRIYA